MVHRTTPHTERGFSAREVFAGCPTVEYSEAWIAGRAVKRAAGLHDELLDTPGASQEGHSRDSLVRSSACMLFIRAVYMSVGSLSYSTMAWGVLLQRLCCAGRFKQRLKQRSRRKQRLRRRPRQWQQRCKLWGSSGSRKRCVPDGHCPLEFRPECHPVSG